MYAVRSGSRKSSLVIDLFQTTGWHQDAEDDREAPASIQRTIRGLLSAISRTLMSHSADDSVGSRFSHSSHNGIRFMQMGIIDALKVVWWRGLTMMRLFHRSLRVVDGTRSPV